MHTPALALFGLILTITSAPPQQHVLAQQPVEMDPPEIVDITGSTPAPTDTAATSAEETAAEPEPNRPQMCPALDQGLILGEMLAPISQGECGDPSPVLVTGLTVSRREIPLAMALTVNCAAATAFADWVKALDAQSQDLADSQIASVTTGGSMVCRGRVGTRSGGLSEHAFANAIDVHGFVLGDGRTVDVLSDWHPNDALAGQLLRHAHRAGCERFTTVLGPEANAAHANHFHFDLKARNSVICQ